MARIFSKWYIYLLSIAISVISFCLIVSFKTAPKEHERLQIFLGAYEAKVMDLQDRLEEEKPDGVKSISLRFNYVSSSNFTYIFSTLRTEMDIIILPKSYVEENEGATLNYFANIDTEYLQKEIGREFDYYVNNDSETKGFKIYDSSLEEGLFKDLITYSGDNDKSDYYLFFSYKSNNIGELNKKSKTKHALELIKNIYENL